MKRRIRLTLFLLLLSLLSACGGPPPASIYADVFSFVAEGRYAESLKNCVALDIKEFEAEDSCLLSELPFIGQESDDPSIDEIMERVVVSHSWMGERFRDALELMPADMRLMFRATTATVIDADMRQSYYWSQTGAIYIAPSLLWTTNAEKDTISKRGKQGDPRRTFGNGLKFIDTWRYTLNNDYAYRSYGVNSDKERTVAEMALPLTRLLYHELAHANDSMPPATLPHHPRDFRVSEVTRQRISNKLYKSSPLLSPFMFELARVRFHSGEPNNAQKLVTAERVGSEHEKETANHFYAYSTAFEDTAMLLEAVMMKRNFDIDMDVAYLERPPEKPKVCDDYKVGWGKRNLIGAASIKPRAQFVAERILPELAWDEFFLALDGDQTMAPGLGWCTNLVLDGSDQPTVRTDRVTPRAVESWRDLNPRIH